MTRWDQDSRRPLDAETPATGSGPARRPRTSSRDDHATWGLIGLAVLGQTLRSRRFYEGATFAAIVVAAMAGLGQENRARTFARLAAWNKRQIELLEHNAERHATQLERKAGRQAKRVARKAKGTLTVA